MSGITIESIVKKFNGDAVLKDISLTIESNQFVVLVGPSGCGKTTLLRSIAGLESVDSGKIIIGNKDVTNTPAKDRDIAMVFQNYALYPHFTVFQNLEFPLKIAKVSKAERKEIIQETAELLQIHHMLQKKPAELSGGQKQRVAIGRALVRKPSVFLFDEPLSNLDARLREEMRYEISNLHQKLKITTVYVTHDQQEAMTLGSKIAILNNGALVQYETPRKLFSSPKNTFVADFLGSPSINIISLGEHESKLLAELLEIEEINPKAKYLGIRPENIYINKGKGLNCKIKMIEDFGMNRLLHLNNEKGIKLKAITSDFYSIEESVTVSFQIKECFSFNKEKELIKN